MVRLALVVSLSALALACAPRARTGGDDDVACAAISVGEGGPLADQQIEDVAPLYDVEVVGTAQVQKLKGAEVVVAPPPGTTRQAFARAVSCHMQSHPRGANDPLAAATSADVSETEGGFAVDIRGADKEQAHEIIRRATTLANGPSTPAAQKLTASM
jgi:hypothetical protein